MNKDLRDVVDKGCINYQRTTKVTAVPRRPNPGRSSTGKPSTEIPCSRRPSPRILMKIKLKKFSAL